MKVIICSLLPLGTPSAARNRLYMMRGALAREGIEAIVVGEGDYTLGPNWRLVEGKNGYNIEFRRDKVPVHYYSPALQIGVRAARFYKRNLLEIIRDFHCSGVIDYSFQAQTSVEILKAARAIGAFVVADLVERFDFSWHNLFNGMLWQQKRLCDAVVPKLDGVIGISKGWCQWAKRQKIPYTWIPSFAEDRASLLRRRESPAGRPFTLVFVGHWIPRELPGAIFGAIKLCANQGIEIRLEVLGNAGKTARERGALEQVRTDAELVRQIDFLGYVDDNERDRRLSLADAFVLLRPDTRETDMLFPTRLPEYLLSSNPVVLSSVGSFPDCFKDGYDVYFVPAENRSEDIAKALMTLHKTPELRRFIGENGRRTALRMFSVELLGKRLAEFLREVARTSMKT